MARMCCPGRQCSKQLLQLVKATRTAFELGVPNCPPSASHNPNQSMSARGLRDRPPRGDLRVYFRRYFIPSLYRALRKHLADVAINATGDKCIQDAEDSTRKAQESMMSLYQLLNQVLVALKESHPAADQSGLHPPFNPPSTSFELCIPLQLARNASQLFIGLNHDVSTCRHSFNISVSLDYMVEVY